MSVCKLCGSENLKQYLELQGYKLDKCLDCGFFQIANQPDEETLKKVYSENFFDHTKFNESFPMIREFKYRMKILDSLNLPGDAKILDAGCATGDFPKFAKDKYEMWGQDISEYAINIAKELNSDIADRFSCGLLEDQNYEPEFFDAIVMWDVIEHLREPVITFSKVLKFLKPGGYILMSTPDMGALTAKLMKKRWAFMIVPEHLCFFDKKTMKILAEKNNSKVVKIRTKGKWVAMEFLLFKAKRMFPKLVPGFLINLFKKKYFNKCSIYVPTNDIQYVVIQKNKS